MTVTVTCPTDSKTASDTVNIRVLEELLGKKANIVETPVPASEPLVTFADISKAKKLLGYEPKVMVEEGLRRFVEWMRAEHLL